MIWVVEEKGLRREAKQNAFMDRLEWHGPEKLAGWRDSDSWTTGLSRFLIQAMS